MSQGIHGHLKATILRETVEAGARTRIGKLKRVRCGLLYNK